MVEVQREKIYAMIKELNDDGLWHPNESPNGNTIYHIYQDGTITYQKGGFAYGQRSEFDREKSITTELDLDFDKFQNKRNVETMSYGRLTIITYGYAIVTCQNALFIRAEMIKLADLMNECNRVSQN
jgi:hypothetical protein